MKLRLKGSSLRLRVTRSELSSLQAGKSIEEYVLFPGGDNASLVYLLEVNSQHQPVQVCFKSQKILISISQDQLTSWSSEHQVGIYVSLPIHDGQALEVSIEKDFACLDLSDEDNKDTFANPMAGRAC